MSWHVLKVFTFPSIPFFPRRMSENNRMKDGCRGESLDSSDPI